MTHTILCFSFYFSIFLGTLMNLMQRSEYSFPPNMGWIIISGLMLLVYNKERY